MQKTEKIKKKEKI